LNSNPNSSNGYDSDCAFDLAIKGDTVALDRLFALCIPRLRRTAARLLCNVQDAEDALQDGLLSAFRHLNQFRGRAQFATWMHTIVVNAAKSKLRKLRSQPLISSLDEPVPEHDDLRLVDTLADPRCNLDEEYAWVERSQILSGIMQELPPASRAVIRLCDIEGLQMKEAAVRLRVSVSALKTRHLRANRLILKIVKEAQPRLEINAEDHNCNSAVTNIAVRSCTKAKTMNRRKTFRRGRHLFRPSLRKGVSPSRPMYKMKEGTGKP
jgi:RNA polymerase sigma-70 factor (ECF subfamily)